MSDGFEMESEPPVKKASGLKIVVIVLAIAGGVGVLACGGIVVGGFLILRNAANDDPASIRQTAQEISEIDVLEGFEPMFSMSLMGVNIAAFGEQGPGVPRMFMLMSFPAAIAANEEQMRQQMDQSLQQHTGKQNLNQLESETRPHSIRGADCQVRIAKVEDDQGRQLRQVTAIFTAKSGSPAMLMLMMPEEEWNDGGEAKMEAMFASMK